MLQGRRRGRPRIAALDDVTPPDPAHPRSLIASDRVIGTDLRRPDGTKVGRIERLMRDKASGRVA